MLNTELPFLFVATGCWVSVQGAPHTAVIGLFSTSPCRGTAVLQEESQADEGRTAHLHPARAGVRTEKSFSPGVLGREAKALSFLIWKKRKHS